MPHQRSISRAFDQHLFAVLTALSLANCMTGETVDDEPEDAEESDVERDEPANASPIPENESKDDHIPPTFPEIVDPDDDSSSFVGYLSDAIRRSDAVVYGEVVDIQHRSLDVFEEVDAPYPHTYVTYEVIEGFKGGHPGERVTLRFLGGPNEDGTLVMHASGIPQFDLGERDIVFVRDNGAAPCPLLSCAAGRLRVVDGLVTSSSGRVVTLGEKGEISIEGEPLDLDVLEHHDFFGRESAPLEQHVERSELPETALELDDFAPLLAELTTTEGVDLVGFTITPEHPLRARTRRND